MNKTGKMGKGTKTFLWIVVAVALVFVVGKYTPLGQGVGDQLDFSNTDDSASCSGISSVVMTYQDLDLREVGTDPGTSIRFLSPEDRTVADDGTFNAIPQTKYTGLAGNDSSYFREKFEADVKCSALTASPKLANAGTATVTITNDNGVTLNGASSQEAVGADGDATWTFKVSAPVRDYVLKHGGAVAIDYDATYWNSFEAVSGVTGKPIAIIGSPAHVNTSQGDSWATFEFNTQEITSDEDYTFKIKGTATGSDPTDLLADLYVVVMGYDYDVNADTGEIIGPALYDEDNNAIFLGNSSTQLYVS